jgi:mucin-19
MATPYVISSDLVSAYPAKSLEIAQYIDGFKADLALVQNAQTGTTYSFVAADFTKLVTLANASPVAVTLPDEATVAWPTGTQLRLLNQGAGTVTVAGAVGVTINGTPLTLTQYRAATLVKTGLNTWSFLPFTSGVGAANFSDTATGTYTGYKYMGYSASGTLTVTTAGFADLVICGGGGGGGNGSGGGGGAGGALLITDAYLPEGTLTVTVGSGGAGNTSASGNGNSSRVNAYVSPGGGGGGSGSLIVGLSGGSGAGGSLVSHVGGAGVTGLGFAGGTGGVSNGCGGGGGAGSVGGNSGAAGPAGNGGSGTTSSIAGTDPFSTYAAGAYAFAGGGGGGSGGTNSTATSGGGAGSNAGAGTNGAANKGGGGGGSGSTASNGGSGFVIVRVAV